MGLFQIMDAATIASKKLETELNEVEDIKYEPKVEEEPKEPVEG